MNQNETNNVEVADENELSLVKSIKINDNLDLNIYLSEDGKNYYALNHFKFENEILLTEESFLALSQVGNLIRTEKEIKDKISKL